MSPEMITLIVVGAVLLVLILWFFGTYNAFVSLKNRVENAWSQIDVQLKRRHDLIPNLVNACKGYMKFEKETLENVVKARNMAVNAEGVKDTAEAENMLTGALKSLFAVVEDYPELKANENVSELMEELTATENKITFARQHYNDSVERYNTKAQQIPANIVASIGGFKQRDFFEIEDPTEREVPKVDLEL